MRRLYGIFAAMAAAYPLHAQVINPPVMPSSFANTLCTNCSMASPSFTGSAKLNGKDIVTSVNNVAPITGNVSIAIPDISGLATSSALSTAISGEVTSRNAAITSSLAAYSPTASIPALAPVQSVNSKVGAVVLPVLTQYVKANLATNASGVYTVTLPANTFANTPAVQITCTTAGPFGWYVVTTGTAAAGYTVTVTFWKMAASVAVLGGSLTVAITTPVSFNMTVTDTN